MPRNAIGTALLAFAAAVGLAARAEAQRPIELGVDGTLARVTSDGGDATLITIPFGRVRAGFFLTDQVSLEPAVGFNWVDSEGETATDLTVGAGLLYHFKTDPAVVRPFLEANAQMQYVKFSSDDLDIDESATQFAIGGGVGVKVPLVNRLDLRLEGFVQYAFETDEFFSSTTFGALFGFSFYTR